MRMKRVKKGGPRLPTGKLLLHLHSFQSGHPRTLSINFWAISYAVDQGPCSVLPTKLAREVTADVMAFSDIFIIYCGADDVA